ncbi:MAG: radical SAM protein [archaeon YNP-LCB-024-027]|nr:radical SAM protein [Candidatus Culexarchaeum yellowstonense]
MVKGYKPLPLFPSISITGDKCGLKCKFCDGRVLGEMLQAESPHELYELIRFLKGRYGIVGVLISGGFDRSGRLPIKPFTSTLREIKRDFDLVVSVHGGLMDSTYASMLRDCGVDIVDFTLYDPKTMRDVVGLNVDWNAIMGSLESVYSYGPSYIAPHILVGSYFGKVSEEENLIRLLKDFKPYILIFLSLLPVKGTEFQNIPPVGVDEFLKLFNYARNVLPGAELALGCMRVRGEYSISLEKSLWSAGLLDRIVLPNYVKVDRMMPFCCSLPRDLEDAILSKLNSKVLGQSSF